MVERFDGSTEPPLEIWILYPGIKIQNHYSDYQCTGFVKNQFNETLISLIFSCLALEINGFIISAGYFFLIELSPYSTHLSFQI